MSYKDLSLNRTQIEGIIKDISNINYQLSINKNTYSYKLYEGSDTKNYTIINVFYNVGGSTTLQVQGKNNVLGELICNQIIEKCKFGENKNVNFSYHNFDSENLNIVIEFLKENNSVNEKLETNKTIYTITSKQGDSLNISYYNNKTFQIQGRSFMVFYELLEIIDTFIDTKELMLQYLDCYDLTEKITGDFLSSEFKIKFPKSHDFLTGKIETIIFPSIALSKIIITLPDYSAFVYPIIRGLEGYLKKILSEFEINISNNREGFGIVFDSGKVRDVYKERLNTNVIETIEGIYKEYKKYRHSLFHVDGYNVETTKIIEDKNDADNIFKNIIYLIETTYTKLETELQEIGKEI